jgi:hypothetical protein
MPIDSDFPRNRQALGRVLLLSSKESFANRTGIRAVALEGSVIDRLYMNILKDRIWRQFHIRFVEN